MKIIKIGQTYHVYSVYTNRAFGLIQLLVLSWVSWFTCHLLIVLFNVLNNNYKFSFTIRGSYFSLTRYCFSFCFQNKVM